MTFIKIVSESVVWLLLISTTTSIESGAVHGRCWRIVDMKSTSRNMKTSLLMSLRTSTSSSRIIRGLKIRIHKPKVIVTFPTRARLDTPTLPIPVAEFMNDGDEELWRIIVVTDIRLTEVESIAKRLEDFYMVNYSHSVKTEVFASRVLHLNAARYGYNMRRYKKVTTEEQEELKLVKGKRHILIKEEEDSKWAGKRLKQNINPRQISPLSEDCILVSYFDLKKGEFLKSSQPRHLNAALKAKNDAYEAGDREGFKFIKEFF